MNKNVTNSSFTRLINTGNRTLFGNAFPTLKQLLIDTAKLIPNPNVHEIESGHKTVFDTWLAQSRDRENVDQPM